MEIIVKEIPGMTLLCIERRVTLPQIPAIAGGELNSVFATAEETHLKVTGPPEFHYYGADGNPDTEFTFVMGVPVALAGQVNGPFQFKPIPPARCASLEYRGSMPNMRAAIDKLYEHVHGSSLQATGEYREVYKHWVDYDSDENITELQAIIS